MGIEDKTGISNSEVEIEAKRNESAGQEKEDGSTVLTEGNAADWQAEAEKNRDLYLRTQADMENMKKRLDKEKASHLKFANESLIKDLLPLLDNLERAIEHGKSCETENGGLLEGVRLTYESVQNVLGKYGVRQIQATGLPFDPNFHDAVMRRVDNSVAENTVLEEVQKGYLLHDRLIRPAMVIVSQKPVERCDD